MLERESVEAWEERKRKARVLGEAAATKLLGPMVLMLLVVMAGRYAGEGISGSLGRTEEKSEGAGRSSCHKTSGTYGTDASCCNGSDYVPGVSDLLWMGLGRR